MKIAFDPQIVISKAQASKENSSAENDRESFTQLCQDFESIVINSLFQQMRKTIPDEGILERSSDMELYREMLDMEIAREMSRKGGLGLGRQIYEQLKNNLDSAKE